ncbi:MAG TPA: protein translocase subunit SecD, partial [Phenylobacterium sp.]|nr:protein translocase subunit SecD [Phenylobacterium sp.]
MIAPSRWRTIAVLLSVIFGLLFSLPNVLPQKTLDSLPGFVPKQRLNLGLDLQGGSYLLLEVDTNALRVEKLTNLVEDVRTTLREEKIDFTDLGQVGGAVSVRITDPAQMTAATNLLRRSVGAPLAGSTTGRDVTINTSDDQRIGLVFSEQALVAESGKAVEQSIEIIRRRIDELGTKEPDIRRQGIDRIVVQAPGESDPEKLKDIIGQTAKLTFQMVDDSVTPEEAAAGRIPPGSQVLPSEEGGALLVKKRALVTGEMLTDASQAF